MHQLPKKYNNKPSKNTKLIICMMSLSLSLGLSGCSDLNIELPFGKKSNSDSNAEMQLDLGKTLSTKFINEIPDYTQYDIKGDDTGNGKEFCAPVAVANSLMWLHKNVGYEYLETELLYPEHTTQEGIILQLASEYYMNTNLEKGTSVNNLLKGVSKYVEEKFGGYKLLEYEGWRKHDKKYATGVTQPNQYRLSSSINKKSATWLNIGWYTYDKSNNQYIRQGGHWVTLVGFHKDKLIIHDPATAHKDVSRNEFISYSILRDGKLNGEYAGLPQEANNYLRLTDGLNIKPEYDTAILDGVVYLEL